jgi:hypothetical protein
MAEKSGLSRGQERALSSLMSAPTIALAAAQAQVSERSIYRWMADNIDFKSEYLRLRREMLNNAVFLLQKRSAQAVDVIVLLMSDPDVPASVRLGAGRTILEMGLEFLKVEALEQKVQQLEERLEEFNEYRSRAGTNGTRHTASTR